MSISTLKSFTGRGTELISLYIPSGRIHDANKLLRIELGKSANIKSRITQQSVESAIKSCQEKLKTLPNGHYAVFCGETSEGWISESVVCPKPLKSIVYRCGSTFDLSILDEMEDKGPIYAIICMDLHDISLAFIRGTSTDIVFEDESMVPAKMSRGGQSNKRFEKNRNLAIVSWFKKCSDNVSDIINSTENVSGVIISGPGITKNMFAEAEYLHHEVRKKVIGVVDTGYVGQQGIRETVEFGGDLLKETELYKQRKLMKEFFNALNKDSLVTYGNNEVTNALKMGRVKKLLLSNEDEKLQEIANKFNSDVFIISDEFEEGKQFKIVFKGIAAILRY